MNQPGIQSIRKQSASQRRGSAAVLGILLIGVMAVLLGMTLDLAHIHVSQAEIQRTADAAALAACWELFDAKVESETGEDAIANVQASANTVGGQNRIASASPQIAEEHIQLGRFDLKTNTFTSASFGEANSVQLQVHRQSHSNGEVPLFFGAVLQRDSQPMTATSIAALLESIDGFHTPTNDDDSLNVLPFALDAQTWQQVLSGQTADNFSYEAGSVVSGSNGKCECNLYPQGTGSPGNRGTVDIGSANNSTSDLARQISSGISRDDLMALGKPLKIDSNGLSLNGDTGISAGVKDELQAIVGQRRVIPIFEQVTGNGNNATYKIVRFAGVRILEVKLTGRMSQKRLMIEPADMIARYAMISTEGDSYSDNLYTPAMLVQ